MKENVVVGHDNFSKKLAEGLGSDYLEVKLHTFLDNEIKPTLQIKHDYEVKGKNVLVVSRTNRYDPKPSDAVIELGFTIKNLAGLQANKIDILMPYAFYARQDESFQKGEPESFCYLADLYEDWLNIARNCAPSRKIEIENLFTTNSHLYGKPKNLNDFFRNIEVHDLDSSNVFGEYLKTKKLEDPIIVTPGPDKLAEDLSLSMHLGRNYEIMNKKRNHMTGKIRLEYPEASFRNRDVIIFDDVAGSGETIAKTFQYISATGPNSVYIALPHLLTNIGIERVCSLGAKEVITTDSLESGEKNNFTELSAVPLFSKYIKKM